MTGGTRRQTVTRRATLDVSGRERSLSESEGRSLHNAVARGNLIEVKSLVGVKKGKNLDQFSAAGLTALHVACMNEIPGSIVEFLLVNGSKVDLHTLDEEQNTPLHLCVEHQRYPTIKILARHGATMTMTNGEGSTPLHLAAKLGDLKALQILLECDTPVNVLHATSYCTAGHIACSLPSTECFEFLYSEGADVEYTDVSGHTLMHYAALGGEPDFVPCLLERGAALDESDLGWRTPVQFAANVGHADFLKALLDAGAKPMSRDGNGHTPLHHAAYVGHIACIRALMKGGALSTARGDDGMAPVHFALLGGHEDAAQALSLHAPPFLQALEQSDVTNALEVLTKFPHISTAASDDQWTPLHECANRGLDDVLRLLLKKRDAHVNSVTVEGSTPLHRAAANGHKETVQTLLELGASIDAEDEQSRTPLHLAAKRGHADVVSVLLQFGAASGHKQDFYGLSVQDYASALPEGWTDEMEELTIRNEELAVVVHYPLHEAAEHGDLDEVKRLLDHGRYTVDAVDDRFDVALHVASEHGHVDIAKYLMDQGTDKNVRGHAGRTPLHLAASSAAIDVLAMLVQEKAAVNSKAIDGSTPLHCVAFDYEPQDIVEDIIQWLLHGGAEVSTTNSKKETPLHIAAAAGSVQSCKKLLEYGAVKTMVDENGRQPYETALLHQHGPCALVLAEPSTNLHQLVLAEDLEGLDQACKQSTVDLSSVDSYGHTPLLTAAFISFRTCSTLLKWGADPNAKDARGRTALHVACSVLAVETIRVLLNGGADIHTVDVNGQTCLHALKFDHPSSETISTVVELLIDHGADIMALTTTQNTPLHIAATVGCMPACARFVRFGADKQLRNVDRKRPTDLATTKGHTELAQFLEPVAHDDLVRLSQLNDAEAVSSAIDEGALNPNGISESTCPLIEAARSGNSALCAALLSKKADVNWVDEYGRVSLHIAASSGNVDTVRVLIEHGSILNAKDGNGLCPLHYAVTSFQHAILYVLLSHGANPHEEDDRGLTPRALAEYLSNTEAIEFFRNPPPLMEDSAQLHRLALQIAPDFSIPIHAAVATGNLRGAQDILTSDPTQAEVADSKGRRPIHLASAFNFSDILKLLLEYEADVNAVDQTNISALHFAANIVSPTIIRILLQAGAWPSRVDQDGYYALHTVGYGHYDPFLLQESLLLLLQAGSDPNWRDGKNMSALHHAVLHDSAVAVATLLYHGAEVDVIDEDGNIPFLVPRISKPSLRPFDLLDLLVAPAEQEDSAGAQSTKTTQRGHRASTATPGPSAGRESVATLKSQDLDDLHDFDEGNELADTDLAASDSATAIEPTSAAVEVVGRSSDFFDMSNPAFVIARAMTLEVVSTALDEDAFALKSYDFDDVRRSDIAHMLNVDDLSPLLLHILQGNLEQVRKGITAIRTSERALTWEELQGANQYNHSYITPLHAAALTGNPEMVRAVLMGRFDVNKLDAFNRTPLHVCAAHGTPEAAAVLIEAGAIIDHPDGSGATPLHAAAHFHHHRQMTMFLAHRADPNVLDRHGYTPLHYAAMSGNNTGIAMLLDMGAARELKAMSVTPLELAQEKKFSKCVQLLAAPSPLAEAVWACDLDAVKAAVAEEEVEPHSDVLRRSITHIGAMCGFTQGLEFLHQHNALLAGERSNRPMSRARPSTRSSSRKGTKSDDLQRSGKSYALPPAPGSKPGPRRLTRSQTRDAAQMAALASNPGAPQAQGSPDMPRNISGTADAPDATLPTTRKPRERRLTFQKQSSQVSELMRHHSDSVMSLRRLGSSSSILLNPAPGQDTVATPSPPPGGVHDDSGKESQGSRQQQYHQQQQQQNKADNSKKAGGASKNPDGTYAEVHSRDAHGCTPLHLAVSRGHLDTVKYLVACGADLEARDAQGRTVLHLLPFHSHDRDILISMSDYLLTVRVHDGPGALDQGRLLDRNAQDNHGMTPLHAAAAGGSDAVAARLMMHGASDAIKCGDGRLAADMAKARGDQRLYELLSDTYGDKLFTAVQTNQQDLTVSLLQSGVPHKGKQQSPPYLEAARAGNHELVQKMIDAGVDTMGMDDQQRTALHICAQSGNLETLQVLLKNADPRLRKCKDSLGRIPLHYAATANRGALLLEFLEQSTEDIDMCDILWNTALHLVTYRGTENHIRTLLMHGAAKDLRNTAGQTAYDIAQIKQLTGVLEDLEVVEDEEPIDPGVRYAMKYPVHAAVHANETRLLTKLVVQDKDLDALDDKGRTPLVCAIQDQFFEVGEKLVLYGADLDIATPQGITPLMAAAASGFEVGLRYLILSGANRRLRDVKGRSAFDHALAGNHTKCKVLLKTLAPAKRASLARPSASRATTAHSGSLGASRKSETQPRSRTNSNTAVVLGETRASEMVDSTDTLGSEEDGELTMDMILTGREPSGKLSDVSESEKRRQRRRRARARRRKAAVAQEATTRLMALGMPSKMAQLALADEQVKDRLHQDITARRQRKKNLETTRRMQKRKLNLPIMRDRDIYTPLQSKYPFLPQDEEEEVKKKKGKSSARKEKGTIRAPAHLLKPPEDSDATHPDRLYTWDFSTSRPDGLFDPKLPKKIVHSREAREQPLTLDEILDIETNTRPYPATRPDIGGKGKSPARPSPTDDQAVYTPRSEPSPRMRNTRLSPLQGNWDHTTGDIDPVFSAEERDYGEVTVATSHKGYWLKDHLPEDPVFIRNRDALTSMLQTAREWIGMGPIKSNIAQVQGSERRSWRYSRTASQRSEMAALPAVRTPQRQSRRRQMQQRSQRLERNEMRRIFEATVRPGSKAVSERREPPVQDPKRSATWGAPKPAPG